MPRFLIEISHSDEYEGCVKSLDAIMKHGSHLITKADFGCSDGVHAGWLIAEVDSREETWQIVPPQYRADARIVQLRRWTQEQVSDMIKKLEG
jgi:hypothetical protein